MLIVEKKNCHDQNSFCLHYNKNIQNRQCFYTRTKKYREEEKNRNIYILGFLLPVRLTLATNLTTL